MFVHRLALALGRTVPELLRGMAPQELGEWLAYFRVRDPERHDNYRTGQICAAIYQTHGVKLTPSDFMPKEQQVRTQTRSQQIAALKGLTDKHAGNASRAYKVAR